MPRETAVAVVKGMLHKLHFSMHDHEKDLTKEMNKMLDKLQAKGPLSFAVFKNWLSEGTKDAQICGFLRLEDRMRDGVHGAAELQELDVWADMPYRYFEVSSSHSALKGGKLKKGTFLRAMRRRAKDPSSPKTPYDYYAEDLRGRVYCVEDSHLTEVMAADVSTKNYETLMQVDKDRGEDVVSVETDPMGLTLPHPVIGVDIQTSVANSNSALMRSDKVMHFLRQCVEYIDAHVEEEGLYRIPGGSRRINEMCYRANQGRPLVMQLGDVENCCSVIVRWLRNLPESYGLLWNRYSSPLRQEYSAASGDDKKRRAVLSRILGSLPTENCDVLKFLLRHFKRVGDADNKMTLKNLDICIPGGFNIPSLLNDAAHVFHDWNNGIEPKTPSVGRLKSHYRAVSVSVGQVSNLEPKSSASRLTVEPSSLGGANRSSNVNAIVSPRPNGSASSMSLSMNAIMSPRDDGRTLPNLKPLKKSPPAPPIVQVVPASKPPTLSPRVSPVPSPRVSPSPSPRASPRASPRSMSNSRSSSRPTTPRRGSDVPPELPPLPPMSSFRISE